MLMCRRRSAFSRPDYAKDTELWPRKVKFMTGFARFEVEK